MHQKHGFVMQRTDRSWLSSKTTAWEIWLEKRGDQCRMIYIRNVLGLDSLSILDLVPTKAPSKLVGHLGVVRRGEKSLVYRAYKEDFLRKRPRGRPPNYFLIFHFCNGDRGTIINKLSQEWRKHNLQSLGLKSVCACHQNSKGGTFAYI